MLNKLLRFIREQNMVTAGDKVICALSGGADSVALLWGLYLLKDKLQIQLEAAHFNHGLRGEESDRDEQFVRELCDRYDIKLHVGREVVCRGKKGLEAAARQARYDFFRKLDGIIATAHTANDNAETILMHMLRGTGLRGLGGIAPVGESLIRPMLTITREEVIAFLQEYHLQYVVDSSNETDDFLRNRLRHSVMPALVRENPRFALTASDMALRLRADEKELSDCAEAAMTNEVFRLKEMTPAIRNRVLSALLEQSGVKEPSAEHVELLSKVVFSDNPSAEANFPGNIKIGRVYDRLEKIVRTDPFAVKLQIPGKVVLEDLGLQVIAAKRSPKEDAFTFVPQGDVYVRSRLSGDEMTLSGGTKSLKKMYIDRKIPQSMRNNIPVIADNSGVVGAWGIGFNTKRTADSEDAVSVWVEKLQR